MSVPSDSLKRRINFIIDSLKPVMKVGNCFGIFKFSYTNQNLTNTSKKLKFLSLALASYLIIITFERHIEIFLFYTYMKCLIQRLSVINRFLQKICPNTSRMSIYLDVHRSKRITPDPMVQRQTIGLISISSAYDLIGETVRLVNEVYSLHIIMSLSCSFSYILTTIWLYIYYYSFRLIPNPILDFVCWCTTEIVFVGVLSYVCEEIESTRNDTKVLVNNIIMDYSLPNKVRSEGKTLMELIDAWPLRVDVFGMFDVNIKLLLSFVSVSTSYLIVIIQISHFY
ncbi:uncharacterized protein LOC126972907 [Leptidea sinapis]|uniref:uncharacterized protein LOC126972907 n=1 Tax=Leptidea sinapis TaxID=189913 RepID=UPI0021C31FDE|nr:uncharacterized protein LOC126972907 [Leptidea sinapis]